MVTRFIKMLNYCGVQVGPILRVTFNKLGNYHVDVIGETLPKEKWISDSMSRAIKDEKVRIMRGFENG